MLITACESRWTSLGVILERLYRLKMNHSGEERKTIRKLMRSDVSDHYMQRADKEKHFSQMLCYPKVKQ